MSMMVSRLSNTSFLFGKSQGGPDVWNRLATSSTMGMVHFFAPLSYNRPRLLFVVDVLTTAIVPAFIEVLCTSSDIFYCGKAQGSCNIAITISIPTPCSVFIAISLSIWISVSIFITISLSRHPWLLDMTREGDHCSLSRSTVTIVFGIMSCRGP